MYWKYRAYDINEQVFDGVIKGQNLPAIALELRQKGLQIITATRIDHKSYVRQNRLQQLRKRLNNSEIHSKPVKKHKKSVLSKILGIFSNPK